MQAYTWFKSKVDKSIKDAQEFIDEKVLEYPALAGFFPIPYEDPLSATVNHSLLKTLNADMLANSKLYHMIDIDEFRVSDQDEAEIKRLMATPVVPNIRIDVFTGSNEPKQAPRLHRIMDLWDRTQFVCDPPRMIELVHDSNNVFITVEVENELAGAVGFRPNVQDRYAELLGVAVPEFMQTTGVGGYLMRTMENICRDNKIDVVFGSVPFPAVDVFLNWGYSMDTTFVSDWMYFDARGIHNYKDWRGYEDWRVENDLGHEYAAFPIMLEKHLTYKSRLKWNDDPMIRQRSIYLEIDGLNWYHETTDNLPQDVDRYGIQEDWVGLPRQANRKQFYVRQKVAMGDPFAPVLDYYASREMDFWQNREMSLFDKVQEYSDRQRTLQKVDILEQQFPGIEWEAMYPNLRADTDDTSFLDEKFLEEKRHKKLMKGLKLEPSDYLWLDGDPAYTPEKSFQKYMELKKEVKKRRHAQGLRTLHEIEANGYDIGLYIDQHVTIEGVFGAI